MRMRKTVRRGGLAAAGLLALGLAVPAGAADAIYAWRTEDGAYAFTDDPKNIPPRYRDAAEERRPARLRDYERYTPGDPVATSDYAQRLAARLEHLRAFNAEARRHRPAGRGGALDAPRSITLRTGDERHPGLDLTPAGRGEGPIVVETVRARPRGGAVTRDNLVVRQGDRVLAIVRSRGHEWDVQDIRVEEELERSAD